MKLEKTFNAIHALVTKRGFKWKRPNSWKAFVSNPSQCFPIIFSHAFCIALWGHDPACNCAIDPEERCDYWDYEAWQFHLSKIALEDPPYIYLLEKWKQKPVTPHMTNSKK